MLDRNLFTEEFSDGPIKALFQPQSSHLYVGLQVHLVLEAKIHKGKKKLTRRKCLSSNDIRDKRLKSQVLII